MLNPREYCFWCMTRLPSPDAKCPACGQDNHTRRNGDDQLPFSQLAGKYIVGHALGRGGFGITYVGLNNQLGKRVAIKEYYPEGLAVRADDHIHIAPAQPEYAGQLQEGMDKALKEARTIASIQSVPHVVRIYDCFGRNNTVYIVMEFIEGETLAERVARKGKMGWREAWSLMRPVGEALDTLHRQGLIHRDISPDNIMISREDGNSILLDFGAASSRIGAGEKRDKLLKDGYAAPEQYREEASIDGRADQYAWAATFLYVLSGKRPGNALQRQYGGEGDFWKGIGKSLEENQLQAFQKAMAVGQEERFGTMRELISALETTDAKEERKPEKRKSRNSPGRIILKVFAALSAICLAGSIAIGLWGG